MHVLLLHCELHTHVRKHPTRFCCTMTLRLLRWVRENPSLPDPYVARPYTISRAAKINHSLFDFARDNTFNIDSSAYSECPPVHCVSSALHLFSALLASADKLAQRCCTLQHCANPLSHPSVAPETLEFCLCTVYLQLTHCPLCALQREVCLEELECSSASASWCASWRLSSTAASVAQVNVYLKTHVYLTASVPSNVAVHCHAVPASADGELVLQHKGVV
jgi:hypothetical protein